jgi:hypothetical protein
MGMPAFFPWLEIEGSVRVDRFRLVRFQRGREPAGPGSAEQHAIDSVLAPFRQRSGPVNVATLACHDGKSYTSDLGETEREELVVFSQIVTFGGLSSRELCAFVASRYCNASDFTFTMQGFQDTANGTFFDVRRRDGYTSVRVTADAYQVPAPAHLGARFRVRLDVPLMEALYRVRGQPLWDRLYESIAPFIRANTDSPDISPQLEVVEMVGALEKALGVWGADGLKKTFEHHFRPTVDISPRDAPRVPPARRNGTSLRRLWIADLYELRNAHAHGSQSPPADLMWDRTEHLLLGAYAFPLLVKSLLREAGVYSLTEDDQEAIDLFEWRAKAREHLLSANAEGQLVWNAERIEFIHDRAGRAFDRLVEAEHGSNGEVQ